jgi:hypothetical protein
MEQPGRERQLATAQLAPAERLRRALDLSDFCLKLAAKGRELRAISSPANMHMRDELKRRLNFMGDKR